jgi:hypothetical protein
MLSADESQKADCVDTTLEQSRHACEALTSCRHPSVARNGKDANPGRLVGRQLLAERTFVGHADQSLMSPGYCLVDQFK